MKNLFYLLLITLVFSCKPSLKENLVQVSTMGTSGSIKYITETPISYQKEIDSLLLDVNMSLSTWIDSSIISKMNRNQMKFKIAMLDSHLNRNESVSSRIKRETNGSFNASIMPLVNYWKVQSKDAESYRLEIDSLIIDSLVKHINYGSPFIKTYDFSAIAKGYGVDVIANFLSEKGIKNYMVEIGGEVNCKGKNINNEYWKIGIEEPNEEARNIFEIVQIKDAAMATSGNYRNFKVLDSGQKIVHIINPKTGYPEISNLLSASIITNNCMEADAYATACMVMGLDTCYDFILKNPDLECYLLYSDENGEIQKKYSSGFEQYLFKN
ncbi:MAG: FAD:protein FMN transferase [Chitinophagales bacterium]